jgi:hypothetical protein
LNYVMLIKILCKNLKKGLTNSTPYGIIKIQKTNKRGK